MDTKSFLTKRSHSLQILLVLIALIDIELVKEKIPLLLSKSSLKKAKAAIDMAYDKITIFGKKIDLYFSTSGHYCVDIYPRNEETNNYEEVMILERDQTMKRNMILKYIKNLAMHP